MEARRLVPDGAAVARARFGGLSFAVVNTASFGKDLAYDGRVRKSAQRAGLDQAFVTGARDSERLL
eukprot:4379398-Lingulodinium_polyedra.AAC.1